MCWSQAESVAGSYRVHFTSDDGKPREAELVLAADGTGTWRVLGGPGRFNASNHASR